MIKGNYSIDLSEIKIRMNKNKNFFYFPIFIRYEFPSNGLRKDDREGFPKFWFVTSFRTISNTPIKF